MSNPKGKSEQEDDTEEYRLTVRHNPFPPWDRLWHIIPRHLSFFQRPGAHQTGGQRKDFRGVHGPTLGKITQQSKTIPCVLRPLFFEKAYL